MNEIKKINEDKRPMQEISSDEGKEGRCLGTIVTSAKPYIEDRESRTIAWLQLMMGIR